MILVGLKEGIDSSLIFTQDTKQLIREIEEKRIKINILSLA